MYTLKTRGCLVILTALPVLAVAQIPTTLRIGPYGEVTSKPFFDPGAGARTVYAIASVGEIRLDVGARRPQSTDSAGHLVGQLGGSLQYNAWGGYPSRQIGIVGGSQYFFGAEHGYELAAGLSTATSLARGEHAQYELTLVRRFPNGHRAQWLARFKIVVIRLPLWGRSVPTPPPLRLIVDSVDAGGVPSNPRWAGARGQDVDRMCRFSYSQMSATPLLIYRPECDSSGVATLNQPLSPRTAHHSGLSCGVKDAEPIIRGHINWVVVNQTGRLRWSGFSPGPLADHDFDLYLEAPQLVTRGNLRGQAKRDSLIGLELNGDETALLFSAQHGGKLWDPLIALPRLSEDSPEYGRQDSIADRLFRDRFAVVTGLLGLDGEHDFHTELHPVLAMAADVSHAVEDRFAHPWLVLMRNMGNEGECSAGEVPWVSADSARPNQYVLEIPWKAGADSVVIDPDSSRFGFVARRNASLELKIEKGRAVRLVADLPRPTRVDSAGIVYGTLWLWWFDHGRRLPNESGVVPIAAAGQVHAAARRQIRAREKHDFEPVVTDAFAPSRRLCFRQGLAEQPTHREPPLSMRPQMVLRDHPTRAPRGDDVKSC